MMLLAPWFLLALPLAAIPVLLHLFNKPRYRREPWGAMMFLEEAVKTRSRSIQIQEWILLILRTLALLLLVLAMTRPAFKGRHGSESGQPTTHVLILDASLSMMRSGPDGTLFDDVKRHALRLVDEMPAQDNMLLIRAGARPEALFSRPVFDKAFLRGRIEQLAPGPESSDLSAALEQAVWLLGFSPQPRHRIYVLDDAQRVAWRPDAAAEWARVSRRLTERPSVPALYSLPGLAQEGGTHLSVTAFEALTPLPDIFQPVDFEVSVRNDSPRALDRRVLFSVNGQRRDERPVRLEPGANALRFTHSFREAGSHFVEVDAGGDDLPIDNRTTLALDVIDQVPVLIIEGRSSPRRLESDGGLLALALEAGRTLDGNALFKVDRIPQLDADRLELSDLLQYKTVVLANVPALSSRFAALMERYLESGGGILLGLGPDVSAASYNRWNLESAGWIPAEIGEWKSYPDQPRPPTFPAGRAGEVLSVFDLSRTRVLDEVQVRGHRQVTPQGDGIVAGRFGDDIFLWYANVGGGRAAVWTIPFRPDSSNFPSVPDFVPLVQNLVTRLAGGAVPPVNLRQGETLTARVDLEKLPAEAVEATVVDPEGRENRVPLSGARGTGVLEWSDTRAPGVYEVRIPGHPVRYVSVSLPVAESDLRPLSAEDRKQLHESVGLHFTSSWADLQREIARETGLRDLWRALLLACLLFLALEGFLAWRFSE
ncbi:MAG: BatA domain-containing protein [Verrucomicrobia bacterium]|nr:BatA domain-containing protein [Verrucomicrobiota bacterium]MCH8525600.1 BatA domain-containing protein [Kiritimatiellia bacterium]